jgi:hypothetical protein
MLAHEEIVMLVQKRAMEGNKCLPPFVTQPSLTLTALVSNLLIVDLHEFLLYHDEARIDPFH